MGEKTKGFYLGYIITFQMVIVIQSRNVKQAVRRLLVILMSAVSEMQGVKTREDLGERKSRQQERSACSRSLGVERLESGKEKPDSS